jgi:hypothetical protein
MIQYLIFLLILFIIIIYGYIYIKYKYQKKKETQLYIKSTKLNNPKQAKLQKSFDQLYNNFKYPLLNYGWGGCTNSKPSTKATKTTKATEIIQVINPNLWF